MTKRFRPALALVALALAFALGGCVSLEDILPQDSVSAPAASDQSQDGAAPAVEAIGATELSGVYVDEESGACLAFDADLPGIAFSGAFDGYTGCFTADAVYACTGDGSVIRLYRADPPRMAADFTKCSYELETGRSIGGNPSSLGAFYRWDGEYTLTYDGPLAAQNDQIPFSDRAQFFSIAFAMRNEPAPAADLMPGYTPDDAGAPGDAAADEDGRYARSTLTESERAFYDAVYDIALRMKGKTDVSEFGMSVSGADRIIQYVLCDAPELFWCNGAFEYAYEGDTVLTLKLKYGYTADEVKAVQQVIDAEAGDILRCVNGRMSEYQKFTAIYTELGRRLEYDKAAVADIDIGMDRKYFSDQTVVGGLAKRKAVCAGISRSLQYLLLKAGIPCYFVTGTYEAADGSAVGPHAWNLVKLEGEWYYADLTNDMAFIKADIGGNYLMTDDECFAERSPVIKGPDGESNQNPELPVCSSHKFDDDSQPSRPESTAGKYEDNTQTNMKNLLYKALREGLCAFNVPFGNEEDAKTAAEAFGGGSLAGQIPAYGGFAICHVFAAVSGPNTVTVQPVYRVVP